jgi:hypothetical protein
MRSRPEATHPTTTPWTSTTRDLVDVPPRASQERPCAAPDEAMRRPFGSIASAVTGCAKASGGEAAGPR